MKKTNIKKTINDLEKKGYSIFNNFLSSQQCKKYKKLIDKLQKGKVLKKFHGERAQMFYNLTSKNFKFFDLVFNYQIIKICERFFKTGAYIKDRFVFQFDHLHARKLTGPCKAQGLHIDSRICGVYPPTSLHMFIYLDKVKKGSGATRIVPKSHKILRYPTKKDEKKATEIHEKEGTMIIMNSSCWHGAAEKINYDERNILILVFNRWFLRQQFALPFDLKMKFSKKLNYKKKMILGYYNYPPINEKQSIRRRGLLTNYNKRN